jgi:hypothetical protein
MGVRAGQPIFCCSRATTSPQLVGRGAVMAVWDGVSIGIFHGIFHVDFLVVFLI